MVVALESSALEVLRSAVESVDAEAGSAFGRAVEQWNEPVRVRVSGRAGCGKSSVRDAVEWPPGVEISEMTIDAPGGAADNPPDADVAVHVLAERVTAPDAVLLGALLGSQVVVVLDKADAFGGAQEIYDACAAAERAAARVVLPLMAILAHAECTDLEPIRNLETTRGELLDKYEMYGIAVLQETLDAEPSLTPEQASTLLRVVSGIHAVNRAVQIAVLRIRGRRDGELLQIAEVLAAGHERVRDQIEAFLRSDEALLSGMHAGLSSGGDEAANDLLTGDDVSAEVAFERAASWRDRGCTTQDADEERAAVAITRGFLRIWASNRV